MLSDKELDEMWDVIVEIGIATEPELGVAVHFNGYNEETLNEVVYYKTGYRDLTQFIESEYLPED